MDTGGTEFERYKRGVKYFAKNLEARLYILAEAARGVAGGNGISREELAELARMAFPGWEGDE